MSLSEKQHADSTEFKTVDHSSATMTDVERGYAKLHTTDSSDSLELNELHHSHPPSRRSPSTQEHGNGNTAGPPQHQNSRYEDIANEITRREKVFWDRLRGKGRRVPGWAESCKNALLSSCELYEYPSLSHPAQRCSGLNALFIFVPIAWASHFMNTNGHWPTQLTFACTCLRHLLIVHVPLNRVRSMLRVHHTPGTDV